MHVTPQPECANRRMHTNLWNFLLDFKGSINIFSTENYCLLNTLQQKATVLASFLIICPSIRKCNSSIKDVQHVLGHILSTIQASFQNPQLDSHHYIYPPLPSNSSHLSFFPNLPQLHGSALYKADKSKPFRESDFCHKKSTGHPTLTLEIFNIYCPCGVFCGLKSCKNVSLLVISFKFSKHSFWNLQVWLSMIMHAVCISTVLTKNF